MRIPVALLVVVLVAAPAMAQAQAVPVRRAVETFRIDAAEHDMTSINFVAVSRRGVIAVGQPQDSKVLMFQPDGRMTSFGRSGGGPGEFTRLARLGWVGDTIWATDMGLWRTTYIGPDAKLVRTTPFPQAGEVAATSTTPGTVLSFILLMGVYADGDVMIMPASAVNGPTPSWVPADHVRDTPLMRWRPGVGFRSIVGWLLAGSDPEACIAKQQSGPNGFGITIPFCPRPATTVSPSAVVSVSVLPNSDDPSRGPFRVIAMDGQGKTRYSRNYTSPRVRVSADDAERTRTRFDNVTNRPTAMIEAMRAVKIPEWYPPFSSVLASDDGWVWIEQYGADGQRRWQVLDPRGATAFTLSVPRNVRLQVVGASTVWGIEIDDDGLQHVVRYDVRSEK